MKLFVSQNLEKCGYRPNVLQCNNLHKEIVRIRIVKLFEVIDCDVHLFSLCDYYLRNDTKTHTLDKILIGRHM